MDNISLDLITAVREGRLERARELISTFGLSYSPRWQEGYVLLCESIKNRKNNITKLLIRNGSRVNSANQASSDSPLHFAVKYGDIEIIEMLLNHGAHVDAISKDYLTPLFIATENNESKASKILIDHGANVNARQGNGLTVLHMASKHGDEDLVKLFLKCGVEVNSKDKEDRTPLHYVAGARIFNCGIHGTIEILLRFGADIYSRDKYGRVALHLAVETGHKSVVKVLLKFSAEIDPRDDRGITPLHIVAERQRTEVVKSLLEYGSDINITSKNNCTVHELVMHSTHSHIDEDDYYNHYRDVTITSIKNHLIKMKVANLFLNDQNSLLIDSKDEKSDFHFECMREWTGINKICYGTVSFHDILTKNENQLAAYARDENIARKLNSEQFQKGMPLYSGLIKARFAKGVYRNWLLERGGTILKSLLPKLSRNCIEKILTYLDNKYLIILTDNSISSSSNSITDDSRSVEGFLPLHSAIENGQKEVATQLIDHGADVSAKDKSGKSPIYYAIENGDVEIAKLLLANKADIRDPCLLNGAVKKGCKEMVEILLRHGADVEATDRNGRTALHFGTYNHQSLYKREIIELLLSKGANVNAKTEYGETALHHASSNGNIPVVEELLEGDADVNCRSDTGTTPLHLSIEYRHAEIAQLLISDEKVNVNVRQFDLTTALHVAVKVGDEKIIRLLLEHGAHVNCQDVGKLDFATPLHVAIKVGDEKIVELLLEHGADVNCRDETGKTPLHLATDKGNEANVDILFGFGANVDCRDKSGYTALHVAAESGKATIVKALLEFGAEVDPRDDRDNTPLHFASRRWFPKVVKVLLEYGADINIVCENGLPLLDAIITTASLHFPVHQDDDEEEEEEEHSGCHYGIAGGYLTPLEQVLVILKEHIIKMKVANLYLSEKNWVLIKDGNKIRKYRNQCAKELEVLKSEICDGTVSFYDILTSGTDQLAVYARNGNIVECLKSGDYERKFPLYAVLIFGEFRRGMRKRRLLDRANVSLNSLLNCCHLPVLPVGCVEKILGFFSDGQLKILTKFSIKECSEDEGPIFKKPKLDDNIT